jgi:MtN3 and saliva related transmembrane protein
MPVMSNPELASLVGSATGVITVISFLPQAVRAWRTKHTKDLSRWTFIMLVTQAVGWTSYGILLAQPPIIWTNLGVLSLTVFILGIKLRYG